MEDQMTSIGEDTQLMLYFGGAKCAKHVWRGDILMSAQSQPLVVINTESKYDDLYEITPEYSDPFVIGAEQYITLYNSSIDNVTNVRLTDYLVKDHEWKRNYQLIQNPINFQRSNINNDPYLIGLMVGRNQPIETIIKHYLLTKLDSLSKYVNDSNDLKMLNLSDINNKELDEIHKTKLIPLNYLYNSHDNRMRLLHGIVSQEKAVIKRSRSRSLDRLSNNNKTHQRSKSGYRPERLSRKAQDNKDRFASKSPSARRSVVSLNSKSPTTKSSSKAPTPRTKSPAREQKNTDQLNTTQPIPIRYTEHKAKSQIPVLKKEQNTLNIDNDQAAKRIVDLVRGLGFICTYADDQIVLPTDLTLKKDPLVMKFKVKQLALSKSVNIEVNQTIQYNQYNQNNQNNQYNQNNQNTRDISFLTSGYLRL